ncbi:MAG TPA: pentapeptide repeat-containing protein [Bryobacteraceae bacterium]|jgi:uncharacterized protein YjbI with pentapeptide repeats|nr:pentapeptide repeat-containing protein [Bryobacteraceae bacterium]
MDNPELKTRPPPAALLRRLFDHQRWLTSQGRYGKMLKGSELVFENCDLAGVDFSKVDLEFSTFRGGSVRGALFRDATLFCTTFDRCDVAGADFGNANLRWAAFITNHDEAAFEGADLTRTAWNRSQKDQNLMEYNPERGGDPNKLWPRETLKPR